MARVQSILIAILDEFMTDPKMVTFARPILLKYIHGMKEVDINQLIGKIKEIVGRLEGA